METSVKVLKYGLLKSHDDEVVREQMRLAHRYRNKLVEIERARRAARREVEIGAGLATASQAVASADAAVAQALAAVSAYKAATRAGSVPAELREALAGHRAALATARAEFRAVRKALREDPALLAACAEVDQRSSEAHKAARAACGVYWGTYLIVEAANDASAKSLPLWDGAAPSDPHFVRWDGEGAVGVQIQGGMAVAALGESTVVRIVEVECPHGSKADPASRLSQKRRRVELWLRVGSGEGRAPRWARFPMVMHRPFPEGARIKCVSVVLRTVGPREEWSANFTVETPAPEARTGDVAVAAHFGWRKMPDGSVRVAVYGAEGEAPREVRIPEEALRVSERPDELRGTRDARFNAAIAGFRALRDRAPEGIPAWVIEAAKGVRSVSRFAPVVRRWAHEAGLRVTHADYLAWAEPSVDAWTLRDLAIWRYHDHHLWTWECDLRQKVIARRKALYQQVAAQIAQRADVLVVDDFDIRDVATKREENDIQAARAQRVRVAPAELRLLIRNAVVSRGGQVVKVNPAGISTVCHVCGTEDQYDRAAHIEHTCSVCGTTWDQDHNALAHLLRRGREQRRLLQDAAPARAAEATAAPSSRWSRRKSQASAAATTARA